MFSTFWGILFSVMLRCFLDLRNARIISFPTTNRLQADLGRLGPKFPETTLGKDAQMMVPCLAEIMEISWHPDWEVDLHMMPFSPSSARGSVGFFSAENSWEVYVVGANMYSQLGITSFRDTLSF